MLARSSLLALALSTSLLAACGGGSAPPPNTAVGQYAARPSSVSYRLPVQGTWRVHRTHYGARNDQAYALDLVLDTALPGRSRVNSDYPSYNQPIVADAPGIVVIAVDGVPDNTPGVVNKYDMHGNYVVIDHQNGEYSLMAHLIPGTVKVRPGQPVNAGSEIGRCGNSGHSTMPHLHWQVMTDANANVAQGVPPRLLPYERNGSQSVELPQKGDRLVGR
jgi:murein DD-endopeptidase MepM/ murein hydrolase activator NlpD